MKTRTTRGRSLYVRVVGGLIVAIGRRPGRLHAVTDRIEYGRRRWNPRRRRWDYIR